MWIWIEAVLAHCGRAAKKMENMRKALDTMQDEIHGTVPDTGFHGHAKSQPAIRWLEGKENLWNIR